MGSTVSSDIITSQFSLTTTANIPVSEYNALYDLYNATNGPHWRWVDYSAGIPWNFTSPELNNPCVDHWQGINCNFTSPFQNYHVIQIMLTDYLLKGNLPSSLAALSKLNSLDLSYNQLTGPIPESLCGLVQLQYIDLSTNLLTGAIPESLVNLSQVEFLILNNNKLAGAIPESLGGLGQLLGLYLHDNQLAGSIPPSLSGLVLLQELHLGTNFFTGTIPMSFSRLVKVRRLVLSNNLITGAIPEALSWLVHLQDLLLDDNQLTGTIPESLTGLIQLLYLDLNSNRLTGSVPESLSKLVQLFGLYLNDNQFTGCLPEAIGSLIQLDELIIGGNLLIGSIPESLVSLKQLQKLDLGTNMLSGTIPTLSLLRYLLMVLLQNNKLTGNVEGLFDPTTQRQVEMVTLNSNQLTGTLPEAIFELKLKSFSAINNCFEGPLPIDAICKNLNMTDFIVDGMSSAKSCQRRLFGATYTLKYDLGGSLPTCLFQLPTITTLHLSGNGFTGTIPKDIFIADSLRDLALSHNALTGNIPSQMQQKEWNSFDLSYNRLSGTLQPRFASNKSINLDNNRLSGDIPSSFYTLRNISILGSNMFLCSYDQSDLPQYDTGRDRYHCGSNSFNGIFFAWLGATSCAVLFVGYMKWRYLAFKKVGILSGTSLNLSLSIIGKLSLAASLYSTVILLPVYSVCSTFYGTQTYAYAYQVSAVFLSGVVPFALNLCLWVLMVSLLAIAVKLVRLSFLGQAYRRTTSKTIFLYWRTAVFIFVPYLSLNCLVVVGANAAYVYVAVYKGGSLLLVTQTLLSVFKIIWGRWMLPHMLSIFTHNSNYGKVQVITDVIVNLLNNIVIPCIVVAGVSPSCFYYALVTAPPVESIAVDAECILVDVVTLQCLEFDFTYVPASFHPPFSYNYQCSASLITYYAPAFVSMCIVSTFVTPLAQYTCQWLYERSTTYPYWHRRLGYILPKLMKPIDLTANVSSKGYLNSSGLMTTLIGLLALILTFGVMFPPLCVALTVTVLASVYMFRVNVRRFINSATEQQRDQIVELLQAECNSVESMQMLKYSVWVLVTVSCWFYTLFLFDTLGDAVGFEKAYWVLIVMPLMPLVLYVVYLVVCKYCINTRADFGGNNAGKDCNSQQSAEVEMQTIGVVHNILVVGEDKDTGTDC